MVAHPLARMVPRAFHFGLHSDAVRGGLHQYLEHKQRDPGATVRIYGEHLFVFKQGTAESEPNLITVYPIPPEFRRTLHRVRHAARIRFRPYKTRVAR